MFSFNTSQLNKALANSSTDGKYLDCGLLRDCFEIVELFLERLERLGDAVKEDSDDSCSSSHNREYTDAVELLDEKVVQGFFIAVLCTIREKAITLSGRIASIFINGGKRSLKHFFSNGKYGLFENIPQNLSLDKRIYLPLFVATLLKNHVFDFSSIGCSHFDIWLLSLVKPFHALKYEMHLAETLRMLELGYMKVASIIGEMRPNYRTNRDLFACAVSHMRRELQQSDPARRMPLRTKYEKLLKSVMQQMRSDMTSLDLNSDQHKDYTSFIREIVALIRSHGTGISSVDSFYLQASAEFSPATEDPELHSALIIGYGLRLGEGDTTAGLQLFSFLYTHFKRFMADGQLDAESKIIENGMSNDNILAFALGRLLPAIIRTGA
ncbi:putative hmg-i hmgdna-binding protein [Diaporthe ampelina]|uniref:Putative hmg-i hmgdna-binding protein n=1 Tax=Diaporthe ampelina TaxID=1214573 RepID=A0A0G2FT17_9PEZI|nr:putative hmg-i hmgdna-binding protein [Diaporthe ampelina]